MANANEVNLVLKYTNPKGSKNAQEILDTLRANTGKILPDAYTPAGRRSKVLDQPIERFWSGLAGRTNKARREMAQTHGLKKYTPVTDYDAQRGVFNNDPEFVITELDVLNHVNKLCKMASISAYPNLEECEFVFKGLVTDLVEAAPDKYITLDQIEDATVESLDPKKPAQATNGAKGVVTV